MPAEIIAPLSNSTVATMNGTFIITVQYNVSSQSTIQCCCDKGTSETPVTINGSGTHQGVVQANPPSGPRDIYVKLDGVEADRETNVDVSIPGPNGGGGS